MNFAGYKIYESAMLDEYRPKMQLSPDCPVSDAFRTEMNAWLLDFFGKEPHLLVNEKAGAIFAHPNVIRLMMMVYQKGCAKLEAQL